MDVISGSAAQPLLVIILPSPHRSLPSKSKLGKGWEFVSFEPSPGPWVSAALSDDWRADYAPIQTHGNSTGKISPIHTHL